MSFADGWCDLPQVVQHRGPPRMGPDGFRIGEGPFGYPLGARDQNRPVVIVNHIMSGHKRTLDNYDWRYQEWVGVTFGLGLDGSASQYCAIWDAHWGNGIAGSVAKYDRTNPRLAALERRAGARWNPRPLYSRGAHSLDLGVFNLINASSIAKEHAGFTGNTWPDAMWRTSIEIDRWCIAACRTRGTELGIVDLSMLAGHMQIDAVNRAQCPGTAWTAQREYAGITAGGIGGGAEVFKPWMRTAKWGNTPAGWVGRTFGAGSFKPNARADLELPAEARMVRLNLEIVANPSELVVGHGAGQGYAGRLTATRYFETIDALIAPDGTLDFVALKGPVTFKVFDSQGYWTW